MSTQKAQKKAVKQTAAVYARTSVDDGEKISISQQIEDGRKLAVEKGYAVTGDYIDQNISGSILPRQIGIQKRKHRPSLTNLLTDIEQGKIQAVVVRKIDRLCRLKTEDGLALLRYFERYDVKIICTNESIPSFSTPEGELQLTLLIAFAAFERKKVSDNVRTAMDYIRRHGKKLGNGKLYGYDNSKKGEILIDVETAEIVKQIFQKYTTGETIYNILKWFNENHQAVRTTRKLSYTQIKYILQNPSYIGKRYIDNVLISTQHPILIDEDTFYKAQKLLAANKKSRAGTIRYKNVYTLTGFAKCSCGVKLLARNVNSSKNKTPMYFCPDFCGESISVRQTEIEAFVEKIIMDLEIIETKTNGSTNLIQIEKIERNLNESKKLISKGVLSASEYQDIYTQAKTEIAKLQTKETKSVSETKRKFNTLSVAEKRRHIQEVLDELIISHQGVLIKFNSQVKSNYIKDEIYHSSAFSNVLLFRWIKKPSAIQKGKYLYTVLPMDTEIVGYEEIKYNKSLVWSPIFALKGGEKWLNMR
jgi:site-specific DNA recombinase